MVRVRLEWLASARRGLDRLLQVLEESGCKSLTQSADEASDSKTAGTRDTQNYFKKTAA